MNDALSLRMQACLGEQTDEKPEEGCRCVVRMRSEMIEP